MKTVLITGASRGIGAQIATTFAENGYNVIINYNKSAEKAMALSKKIGMPAFKADVSNFNEVHDLVTFAVQRYGKIDVLVNNAGIALKQMVLQDVKEDEFDKLVNVNLKSLFNCCKCVIPHMVSAGYGSIINMSSMWGQTGGSCEVAYSMTKSGVIGFTKALANELAPSKIRVNCVAPGFIDTDMNAHLSKEDVSAFKEEIPLGRIGNVKDIAEAVLFLASEKASYITGQVLNVNGGII